jgi:hypothetical protein
VGLAAAVRETGAGIVADGDLGGTLRDALADPDRLDAMGRLGTLTIRDRFGWGAVAAEMETIYRGIAG